MAVMILGVACGGGNTKHDLLSRAENVETRAQLEKALGPPDDRSKLGPVETWTYHASDGDVVFLITGDKVRIKSTSDKQEE